MEGLGKVKQSTCLDAKGKEGHKEMQTSLENIVAAIVLSGPTAGAFLHPKAPEWWIMKQCLAAADFTRRLTQGVLKGAQMHTYTTQSLRKMGVLFLLGAMYLHLLMLGLLDCE